MFRRRRSTESSVSGAARHVAVVAGTIAEWIDLDEAAWEARLGSLGSAAASAGVTSLRIVPRGGTGTAAVRRASIDGCRVVVDPRVDGRANIASAVAAGPHDVTERSILEGLDESGAETDLVLVIGAESILPTALVWELAYAELVYIDATWQSLSPEHVCQALDEFAARQRRFGGVIE